MLKIKKHLVGYEKESLKWCVFICTVKSNEWGVFNVLDALLYELYMEKHTRGQQPGSFLNIAAMKILLIPSAAYCENC